MSGLKEVKKMAKFGVCYSAHTDVSTNMLQNMKELGVVKLIWIIKLQ